MEKKKNELSTEEYNEIMAKHFAKNKKLTVKYFEFLFYNGNIEEFEIFSIQVLRAIEIIKKRKGRKK